jgi:hypothetical protein
MPCQSEIRSHKSSIDKGVSVLGEEKFRNIGDIEKFENIPIDERLDVFNTYDLIKKNAAINPEATAISFFLSGDSYDQPMQVIYRDLMANITKTANLFHDLGVGPHDVISYRLPGIKVAAAVGRPDPHAGEVPVAYVQLQENTDLSTQEILDYLQKEIGERAAIPKEITIIDEIPLTPVGKIFKPALRWDAIKKVYESKLEALGAYVKKLTVAVKEDKVHGSIVSITIKTAEGTSVEKVNDRVAEILSRYTVKYQLKFIEN